MSSSENNRPGKGRKKNVYDVCKEKILEPLRTIEAAGKENVDERSVSLQ